MNLNDLANRMDTLAKNVPVAASNLAKQVATVVHTDLAQVTPVDTGAAMSNWQVSLNAPVTGAADPFVPSPRGRMIGGKWTHTVDPQITHQSNIGPALDAAKLIIEAKQPGEAIFITNNVPYIQPLDEGHSSQIPSGFVDRSLILAKDFIARAKLSL